MVDNGTEYMEVEQPVLPFVSYQLNSLSSLIGSDDVSSIVESHLSISFCNLVAKLSAEIAILYGMDESVEEIGDDSGIKGFLFDLSAFLGELECPHECITCGPIEERFVSSCRRKFLFNYLMAEMKTARLFALRTIETSRNADSTNELSSELTAALNTLNISKPTGSVNLATVIATLQDHAVRKLQSVSQRPRLLFRPSSMDSGRWKQVESVVRALGQDCRSRHLLLLKRMDVTVNSFLWSDKIRKHEEKIRSYYSEQRDKISQLSVPGISALISASDDLLKIEQASSKKRREHTKSHLKPEGVNTAPADRGGRTDDIRGLRNESFAEQRFNDGNRGRGGFRGNRGRGGYSRGGRGGFQMSHENIVRQEYQNRSGRGEQGDKRGRGRGNY